MTLAAKQGLHGVYVYMSVSERVCASVRQFLGEAETGGLAGVGGWDLDGRWVWFGCR